MKKVLILALIVTVAGCSNSSWESVNPSSGTVTLYSADGTIIQSHKTVGMPEMHEGGHLYMRDRDTGELVIVYGTYVFEEGK